MSLHYSDESKRPKRCYCWGQPCPRCNSTGTLGDPEARPDIETYRAVTLDQSQSLWNWRSAGTHERLAGRYPTEATAVEAARKALGVKS